MLKTFKSAWNNMAVRKSLLYTLFMIIVIRVGSQIPVPGTNASVIKNYLEGLNATGAFNIFNSFTGNSLESFSVLALSITPYITASIIIELLTVAIPRLEELQRDGNEGRKKIAELTRYATVVLAVIESVAMTIGFSRQSGFFTTNNLFYMIVCVIALTAGSAFLMWVGERITEKGVGNGISIVLLVNILCGIPSDLKTLFENLQAKAQSVPMKVVYTVIAIALILVIVAFVVWLNGAVRKIAIQHSGKIVGRRTMGGQSSHIPLKVLTASVIPVIFASSLMSIPSMIMSFIGSSNTATFWTYVVGILSPSYWFRSGYPWYFSLGVILYLFLIFVFSYFYTSITFNPTEVAENLKKQGGMIPGIRPGQPTAKYLNSVLNTVVFIGACGLSIVALIPIVLTGVLGIVGSISFLGTSLIIIVGVILETCDMINGRLASREYDSLLG